MPVVLQSLSISYKPEQVLKHARPRDEPEAAPGARFDDLSESAAPPPSCPGRARGGSDDLRL